MIDTPQAKFLTPAETILKLTRDIMVRIKTDNQLANTRYLAGLDYQKSRQLLSLAIADKLGHVSTTERTRMSEALEKLDELFKKNRRKTKHPPAEKTGDLL